MRANILIPGLVALGGCELLEVQRDVPSLGGLTIPNELSDESGVCWSHDYRSDQVVAYGVDTGTSVGAFLIGDLLVAAIGFDHDRSLVLATEDGFTVVDVVTGELRSGGVGHVDVSVAWTTEGWVVERAEELFRYADVEALLADEGEPLGEHADLVAGYGGDLYTWNGRRVEGRVGATGRTTYRQGLQGYGPLDATIAGELAVTRSRIRTIVVDEPVGWGFSGDVVETFSPDWTRPGGLWCHDL